MSDEIKILNGRKYQKKNGQWFDIGPADTGTQTKSINGRNYEKRDGQWYDVGEAVAEDVPVKKKDGGNESGLTGIGGQSTSPTPKANKASGLAAGAATDTSTESEGFMSMDPEAAAEKSSLAEGVKQVALEQEKISQDNEAEIRESRKRFTPRFESPVFEQYYQLAESERKQDVKSATDNVLTGKADLKDFQTLYKSGTETFNQFKQTVSPDESVESAGNEDDYIWRVYKGYQNKLDDVYKNALREKAVASEELLKETMPFISKVVGIDFEMPATYEDAKKIADAIAVKRYVLSHAKSMKDAAEKAKELYYFENNVSQAYPYLKDFLAKKLFEEKAEKGQLSADEKSIRELGKEIYKTLNPNEYKRYEEAGGDQRYGGWGGLGWKETPKAADKINRDMLMLGIEAYQTYGNKYSMQAANEVAKTLGWKYTLPLEEETKQMIAAKIIDGEWLLDASIPDKYKVVGTTPTNASQELKDLIAETLPSVNRDIWFEKNKTENNVKLPNTGFTYSAGVNYKKTIEDAAKTLTGWLDPEKNRTRALASLQDDVSSDIIGENPLSKQRLSYLRTIQNPTPEQKEEINNLEKYTDVRSWWDKLKDLSGQGVGQFTGLATISAFTGGLSQAKNVGGALMSLVSPASGKTGTSAAAYLMSFEENAKESTRLFAGEGNGFKRFLYANVASGIDAAVERLFPEEKFLSKLVSDDVARFVRNLAPENIRSQMKEGLVEKMTKSVINKIAKWQTTPLQESAEEVVGAMLKSTFEGMINPDAETITFGELKDIATEAFLSSQIIGAPKGLLAQRNKTVSMNTVWDAASDPSQTINVAMVINDMKENGELTEQEANDRLKMLNTASVTYWDNPVLRGEMGGLSLSKKQNYFARLLNEKVLSEKADALEEKGDKVAAQVYRKEIAESEKAREDIYTGRVVVDENNDEKPDPDEELLAELRSKAPKGSEQNDLQYFVDKAAEDPAAFMDSYGKKATNNLMNRVPTEKLVENRDYLVNNFGESESTDFLTQIISQRGKAVPLTQTTQDANDIITGKKVFERFSPQEQRGFAEGGTSHVEATLLLAADEGAGGKNNATPEAQENRIEQYARDKGIWDGNTTETFTSKYGEPIAAGEEAVVWGDEKNGTVIKTQDTFQYENLQQKLDGITLHNAYFPEAAIKVIGFGRNANGEFQVIVEQPHIQGEKLTPEEIKTYLESVGFKEDENGNFSNGEVIIEDVHTGNAIKDKEGNIIVIDPIMRLNTEAQGYGGKRKTSNKISPTQTIPDVAENPAVESKVEPAENTALRDVEKNFETKKAELETEKNQKIKQASKPELSLDAEIDDDIVLKSKKRVSNIQKHDKIKKEFEKLKEVADCIYG